MRQGFLGGTSWWSLGSRFGLKVCWSQAKHMCMVSRVLCAEPGVQAPCGARVPLQVVWMHLPPRKQLDLGHAQWPTQPPGTD